VLLDILREIVEFFDVVYVTIDALDESMQRTNLLDVLDVLITNPHFERIQLLATSREYLDIKRVMRRLYRPLSMSNSFVEGDIRTYVARKIRAELKFQRWPLGLRIEVEKTLSIGAKGMFRWAVCQLDILRRLNHQTKVREAIKSLPRTLDKTYERLFSYIVEEERDFLQHVLYRICFHDLLFKGAKVLPAGLLIDSYTNSDTATIGLGSEGYLCDLESLKDTCGCLVTFTVDKITELETVDIAHYTVREFLESDRISVSPAAWLATVKETSYAGIMTSILEHSMSAPLDLPQVGTWVSPLDLESDSSFLEYCLVASVRALQHNEGLVEPRLAFQFLDHLQPHFQAFQDTAIRVSAAYGKP